LLEALVGAFPSSRNVEAVFASLAKTDVFRKPTTDAIAAVYATERNVEKADMIVLLCIDAEHFDSALKLLRS
jgi:hypothetical protein